MAIVLGLDAILMRGPAGSTGSTEVKNVKDGNKRMAGVGRNFERGVA